MTDRREKKGGKSRDGHTGGRAGGIDPRRLPPGSAVESYAVRELLAHAERTTTYLAHTDDGDAVALKVFDPEVESSCVREAEVLRTAPHPSIAPVLSVGKLGSSRYVATAHAAGGNARDLIRRCGPLDTIEVLELGFSLASALSHAHGRGVLHLNLRPENVVISGEGPVLMCDFGRNATGHASSALLAGPQSVFVAPEVRAGRSGAPQSDLYSLGALLYLLLTGSDPAPVIPKSSTGWPGLGHGLLSEAAQIVEACVATVPSDRPLSAAELASWIRETRESLSARFTSIDVGAEWATGTDAEVVASVAQAPLAVHQRLCDGLREDADVVLLYGPGRGARRRAARQALRASRGLVRAVSRVSLTDDNGVLANELATRFGITELSATVPLSQQCAATLKSHKGLRPVVHIEADRKLSSADLRELVDLATELAMVGSVMFLCCRASDGRDMARSFKEAFHLRVLELALPRPQRSQITSYIECETAFLAPGVRWSPDAARLLAYARGNANIDDVVAHALDLARGNPVKMVTSASVLASLAAVGGKTLEPTTDSAQHPVVGTALANILGTMRRSEDEPLLGMADPRANEPDDSVHPDPAVAHSTEVDRPASQDPREMSEAHFRAFFATERDIGVSPVPKRAARGTLPKVPVGRLAVYAGKMTEEQVDVVLSFQKVERRQFGQIAVDAGYLTEEELTALLHHQRRVAVCAEEVLTAMKLLRRG